MDAVELDIQSANTVAFIAERPVSLTLTPTEKTRTPAGGWKKTEGTARSAQTFRIIEPSIRTTPPQVKLQDGSLREVAFWLLGAVGTIVEQDDHWTDGMRKWLVADVIRDNGYEVRAIVVEDGA